ncbi:MAG: LuxR family transcriptional regulator [Proteobacteria bacterium]|nr:LuxR family transcriptional regulator [Pseudomonadota bacterium]
MNRSASILTDDETVFARIRSLATDWAIHRLGDIQTLNELPAGSLVIVDTAASSLSRTSESGWRAFFQLHRIVMASSQPSDDEGLRWLNLGASGYCHAYGAPATLQQVLDVVASDELWVGRSLMKRLLAGIGKHRTDSGNWVQALTPREREVAQMAADGESNLAIAEALGITERTVKSHLTTIFEKLAVSDRLQLALKVHGIR